MRLGVAGHIHEYLIQSVLQQYSDLISKFENNRIFERQFVITNADITSQIILIIIIQHRLESSDRVGDGVLHDASTWHSG